ncbi:cupin domain-containing protein [Pseudomonas sp. H9]|uniref:cupin domain-containing protein n=1 Tax=Pseudomonas sp. H9 TaxID=483968 RepID=UPI0010582C59|nr:cupin domain-containing protein [Pseudomonas sp. H9]TDF82357.1 anti-sigma factor [Pseudomonas sp. H9]
MLINADFTRPVVVAPHQYQWVASPQAGVDRVMLDRVGAENARATSIVRYAPGSCFSRHLHPGGEEILVLSGTFSDERADYPAGWYLRNPPGSSHQPSSAEGAVIFVKLQQMPASEQRPVRINTRAPSNWYRQGSREVCPLFADDSEQVSLQRLVANEHLFNDPLQGFELLVLEGSVTVGEQPYERGTWLRLPAGHNLDIVAGQQGATAYLKTGHLTPSVVQA